MRTKEISIIHETEIANRFSFDGARRSKSSGASPRDPIDVTTTNFVIECEYTEKESKSIKKDLWFEVRMKAFDGKQPIIAIRFHDDNPRKCVDLIVQELDEFLYKERLLKDCGCQ